MVPIRVSEKPKRMPEKKSGQAARSSSADQGRRYVPAGRQREDRHRHDAMDRTKGNLGWHADAKDQQYHRIQRDFGYRISGKQKRFEDLGGHSVGSERKADRQSSHYRNRQRTDEGRAGLGNVTPEAGGLQQSAEI